MMKFFEKDGICFCPVNGRLPEGAVPVKEPFDPLVFLVWRDPLVSRGIFAITQPWELYEREGIDLFMLPGSRPIQPEAEAYVKERWACVLNTAFARCFDVLPQFIRPKRKKLRLNTVGLGDVGGTLLTGLVLLDGPVEQLGIFDAYRPLMERYRLELNQVLPTIPHRAMPKVVTVEASELMDCDVFVFTASGGVPPVGSEVQDVRMAQYETNREMVREYARRARDEDFRGMFCQVSDPVDQLARYVFLESNRDEEGRFDFRGLLPEQVRGFGLGVMEARARFAARERGIDFTYGTVYGPHGKDLIVVDNPCFGYSDAISRQLTEAAVSANLAVRELGFKPYIAPGLSSAAISIMSMLRGEIHAAAIPIDGAYFGCHGSVTRMGTRMVREMLHPTVQQRIIQAHKRLKEFPIDG